MTAASVSGSGSGSGAATASGSSGDGVRSAQKTSSSTGSSLVDGIPRSAREDCSHGEGEENCKCPPSSGMHRPVRDLTESDRTYLSRLASDLSSGEHGTLHLRSEGHFTSQTRLFNRSIVSPAICLVKPLDTRGVQLAVLAAREAGWSVSVKAGGYGTTGWAVQGDLVIDLCRLNEIKLHLPDPETGVVRPPAFVVDRADEAGGSAAKRRTASEAFGDKASSTSTTGTSSRDRSRSRSARPEEGRHKRPTVASGSVEGGNRSSPSGSSDESRSSEHDALAPPSTDSNLTPPASADPSTKDGLWTNESPARPTASTSGGGAALERRAISAPEPRPTAEDVASVDTPSGSEGRPDRNRTSVSEPVPDPSSRDLSRSGSASLGTPTGSSGPSSVAGGPAPASWNGLGAPGVMTYGNGFSRNPSDVVWHGMPVGRDSFFPDSNYSTSTGAAASGSSGSAASGRTTNGPVAGGPGGPASTSTYSPPLPAGSEGQAGILSDVPALVTFGAGVKAKDLDTRTGEQGYHVPVSAYPVGGAIFSTGGFGFLSRMKSLSMDNVVAAEMVLSDGRVVHLTEEYEKGSEEEELWWAFRGVGPALGVVTKVRCKAWKVGLVHAANIIYPFNPVTTPSLLRHWRDCLKNVPPELYANLILTAGPRSTKSVVVIQLCYFGAQADGDRFVSAITSWEGERPHLQDVAMCTLLSQQDKVAMVLDSSRPHSGNRWCIRSDLITSLTDQTITDTCRMFTELPERSAWLFEIAGQAIADVDPSTTCFPRQCRAAPFQVAAIHQWGEQSADTAWTNAAVKWIDGVISPHSPGGPYPCFLETRTEKARFVRTFGGEQNWQRLRDIKRKVDPTGMFEYTLWPSADTNNIKDTARDAAAAAAAAAA